MSYRKWTREVNWLGAVFASHYRRRARESSVYAAARQMRKQGFPIDAALVALRGVRHV